MNTQAKRAPITVTITSAAYPSSSGSDCPVEPVEHDRQLQPDEDEQRGVEQERQHLPHGGRLQPLAGEASSCDRHPR